MHDATHPDFLPLGPGPRPTTGDELAHRLRQTVAESWNGTVQGIDRVHVAAVTAGSDVTSLHVDLTGLVVRPAQKRPEPEPWRPQVRAREEARMKRLRIDAHPLTVEDLPVDVTAEIENVRFAWIEGTDGRVGVELVDPSAAEPLAGHARIAVDKKGLVGTVHGMLAVALAGQGLTLSDFDVDLQSQGPRSAELHVKARVRRGFLSAPVQATASAEIDGAMVLTVGDVRITSSNPIIAALLTTVRGRIESVARTRIDLATELPPGVRIIDVRLDAGEELAVSARLG